MLTTYDTMLPYIVADVPGCPENVVLHALRSAAREFCGRTELWWKELTAMNVVADQVLYPLDPDVTTGTEPEIRRIDYVKLSGAVCEIDNYKLVENTAVGATTSQSLQWDTNHIPGTAVTAGLKVAVILVPDWETDVLPDYFMSRWGDGIVAKAAYDLLLLPGRTWTNGDLAIARNVTWLRRVNDGIKERYTGHKNAAVKLAMPKWV